MSAGTRSTAEDTFLRLSLPEPLVNVAFLGFEVDIRWPDRRLTVEVDGPAHRRPSGRNADALRDEALRGAGYDVLRFSADDVHQRQRSVTTTVADARSVRTPT